MTTLKSDSRHSAADAQQKPIDMLLTGGTVLNVYSGELLKADVTVHNGKIWSVGHFNPVQPHAARIIDVTDKVLVPGYIEPHAHADNIYNPISFGEEACKKGVTTIFCDNLVYFPPIGVTLFEELMNTLSKGPVKFFWFCRTNPQTAVANEDEIFSLDSIETLIKNPFVRSIGEITRWPDMIKGNSKILNMIDAARKANKRVDGHLAGAKFEKLNVLARVGVESCHESITGEDVLNRLRLGLYVILRESSLRRDLADIIRPIVEKNILTERLMLTTDSSTAVYYDTFGMTDHLIDIAIKEGIPPVLAYRMVTLNPAVYYGLDRQIGGIAPGRDADILILKDLYHPVPETTISKGRVIAKNGNLAAPFPQIAWEKFFPKTLFVNHEWRATADFFKIFTPEKSMDFPVVEMISAVITRVKWTCFDSENGHLTLQDKEGVCHAALLDRNGRWITNGMVGGFGDGIEGLASSYNTAREILVLGRSHEAMKTAVNRVLEMKGGIVLIEKGEIIYEFPLPLLGYGSYEPLQLVARKEKELIDILLTRGYRFHDPFYTLAFLPNDFLPDARINYNGVVDIKTGEVLWPRKDLKAQQTLSKISSNSIAP
ncbi:MAG: adenine deaminase C-terminal domain-containing protein [Desulfobacterales bacterium]|jgi:adenine deaminase|nr:adenine deaminase C-terminal domain-containing protein [Desulfobacterales bacterium]